ncbi:hypothetical protein Cni_G09388 [Canna indica]|uniref:TNase-like domain-containing protein n=1 Tax=Canna indica TaxID=4628 RepID=A0AAQ3Q9K7_9LILI|nr:hypothetical protein Cni_G09388 [Canna indica]
MLSVNRRGIHYHDTWQDLDKIGMGESIGSSDQEAAIDKFTLPPLGQMRMIVFKLTREVAGYIGLEMQLPTSGNQGRRTGRSVDSNRRVPGDTMTAQVSIQAADKTHQTAGAMPSQGLLAFYGLPLPHTISEISVAPSSRPEGMKYELQTLPVDAKVVADGDTITIYVDIADSLMRQPLRGRKLVLERTTRRQMLFKKVISGPNNEETLAQKYRIRLRGIDAPESSMPFGKEAKEELVKLVQGKQLKVYVYGDDRYGHCGGDIYCNVHVTEEMLKKGIAWHYAAYDQRQELSKWEKEARVARIGLWASSHPEKPWEWRKERRNGT